MDIWTSLKMVLVQKALESVKGQLYKQIDQPILMKSQKICLELMFDFMSFKFSVYNYSTAFDTRGSRNWG